MSMIENKLPKRIYTIEFLRIFFVFFIILGHIMQMYPEVKSNVLDCLNTRETHTWFGVEFFFIIGGFFLYRRISSEQNIWELTKKIYIRLMPPLLFVFLVCFVVGTKNSELYFSRFPLILTLTAGVGLPGEATGWGDWYVSTYFWCSLLYMGILWSNPKGAFLWIGILMYCGLILKFNAPYEWMGTYYTIICTDFVRGLYSFGLGIVIGYLSLKIKKLHRIEIRLFFTVLESYFLFCIVNYIARSSYSQFSFWEIELIFSFFLICCVHSLGYITQILNNCNKVYNFSKYTYSIFLCHIPCMSILWAHNHYGLSGETCALVILGGAIIIGIAEYHLIEQKLVPYLKKYFKENIS